MKDVVRSLLLRTAEQKWQLEPGKPIYILSPHIDDAVWSMGALLRELSDAGYEVNVVNLFSQTIFVYGGIQSPPDATGVRKAEDELATTASGIARVYNLDYPDGVLRDTPLDGVLNSGYQAPEYLLQIISQALAAMLPQDATVLAPLALGGHMDHLTTRHAALRLGRPLVFFEDLPYAARPHDTTEELAFQGSQSLQSVRVPLEPAQVALHLKLYELYGSQRADIDHQQIQDYLSAHGYGFWS